MPPGLTHSVVVTVFPSAVGKRAGELRRVRVNL